jgi:hypothetical protein
MQSLLFSHDRLLEACGKKDLADISVGAAGDHVSKIQTALFLLTGISVSSDELKTQLYGASTAGLVLAFQARRKIYNERSVGRTTIAALDREVATVESRVTLAPLAIRQLTYTPA